MTLSARRSWPRRADASAASTGAAEPGSTELGVLTRIMPPMSPRYPPLFQPQKHGLRLAQALENTRLLGIAIPVRIRARRFRGPVDPRGKKSGIGRRPRRTPGQ